MLKYCKKRIFRRLWISLIGSELKKGGVGVASYSVFEIGDLEGSVRPGNVLDTHSPKWPHAGFGPAAFNYISTACIGPVFGNAPARNKSPDHPSGRSE